MPDGLEQNNAIQQALIDRAATALDSSRKTTFEQMILGCVLLVAGAAVGLISVELRQTAVAASFGTALIGAGATLLPAGASASANSALHHALSQLAILAGTPAAAAVTSNAAAGAAVPYSGTPTATDRAPDVGKAAEEGHPAGNGGGPTGVVRSTAEADAANPVVPTK
jgi:hypothetical protein